MGGRLPSRTNQFGREAGESIIVPFRPSVVDGDVLTLDIAEFVEPLPERFDVVGFEGG